MKIRGTGAALLLLGVIAALLFTVSACGEEEKQTIVFTDLDWPSAHLQGAIAKRIIEDGYGYETDGIRLDTIPGFEALVRGDTHISMEIWLPNQQEAYDSAIAEGTIQVIGNSLEDNWQSAFIIPNYVAEANPGLKTPQDLTNPEYMELFVTPDSKGKARLLNCIPGWECEKVNEKKIAAYGLDDAVELVNPGSDAALAAEIRSAFEQQEPVLFYYWGPTVLSYDLDTKHGGFTFLEEPPYTEECWEGDSGCAYPTAEVLIVMRSDLADDAPELVEFLEKWDFNAGNQLAAEGYMNESGAEFPAVAEWFLKNTDEWKSWVSADALEKVEASLAAG